MIDLIVSNTGPLIALGKINSVHILTGLATRVLIPRAVHQELGAGVRLGFDVASLLRAHPSIEVLDTPPAQPLLEHLLDYGEAATIALACQEKPNYVLLDERKGRKVAADIFHLKVIGTGGLLVLAKRNGLLTAVKEPLDQMIRAGYHIHERIRDRILCLAGETG